MHGNTAFNEEFFVAGFFSGLKDELKHMVNKATNLLQLCTEIRDAPGKPAKKIKICLVTS